MRKGLQGRDSGSGSSLKTLIPWSFRPRALFALLNQHRFPRLVRLVEGGGRFRRHIILVVFRKHLVRAENAISSQLSLRHNALAFLEEIGKNALIYHWNDLRGIGNQKLYRYSIALALDAAFFHQTADPKALAHRRFVIGHLSGAEEKYEIALEGVQNQYGSDPNAVTPEAIIASFL